MYIDCWHPQATKENMQTERQKDLDGWMSLGIGCVICRPCSLFNASCFRYT
jgi:hypothetical protein